MKKAIIAGNAPSLASIDYARLPKSASLFRCNQFYLEDKYYLGKEVDYVFFVKWSLLENYYTLRHLQERGEYHCKQVFCNGMREERIANTFPAIRFGSEVVYKLEEIFELLHFHYLYHGVGPTTGIYMCIAAVAMGYEELYLAGIDLYESKQCYAYDTNRPNLLQINPNVERAGYGGHGGGHAREFDLRLLEMLQARYGARIYSLCPDSPISQHIPLAPLQGEASLRAEEKPQGSIRDMLIPSAWAYASYGKPPHNAPAPAPVRNNIYLKLMGDSTLRDNLCLKLARDLLRLPFALARALKRRICK